MYMLLSEMYGYKYGGLRGCPRSRPKCPIRDKFIVNLKTTATAAAMARLTDTSPPGSLANPASAFGVLVLFARRR